MRELLQRQADNRYSTLTASYFIPLTETQIIVYTCGLHVCSMCVHMLNVCVCVRAVIKLIPLFFH